MVLSKTKSDNGTSSISLFHTRLVALPGADAPHTSKHFTVPEKTFSTRWNHHLT